MRTGVQEPTFVFNEGEIDIEVVETESIFKSTTAHPNLISKFRKELVNIPEIRKVQLQSSPSSSLYVTFGCIMLDNIIANENSYLIKQISAALSYLSNESRVDYSKQKVYEKVGRDFVKLTDFVASERKHISAKKQSISIIIQELSKRVYRKISSQDEYVTTIVVLAQALLYAYIMKSTSVEVPEGFIQSVCKSLYVLEDKHIKSACELFAKLLSYKLDLLDINFEVKNSEKITTVFYPDSIRKDYKHQAVVLMVGSKTKQMKAFGYPLEELEKKIEKSQVILNGNQEIKESDSISATSNELLDSKYTEQTTRLENGFHDKTNNVLESNHYFEEKSKIKDEDQKISFHKDEITAQKEETVHLEKARSKDNEGSLKKNGAIATQKEEEVKSQKEEKEELKEQDKITIKEQEISIEKVGQKVETSKKQDEISVEEKPEPKIEILAKKPEISIKKQPEELIACNLCVVPVNSIDVFKNNICGHKYCIYCVQDSEIKIKTFCLLRQCQSRMDSEKFLRFVDECQKRQNKEEEEYKKPLLKTSSVIQTDGKQSMNGKSDEKPAEKIMLEECKYCFERRDVNKIFLNPCGHKFCTKCLQKKTAVSSQYCPASGCFQPFDYDGMNSYFEQQMTEDLVTTKIACKGCNAENEFKHSKSAIPEYYKCEKCSAIACLRHDDLMSKCLCYCERCLSTVDLNIRTMIKFCKKCSKGYCALCGDKKASDKPCECVCLNCLERKDHATDEFCSSCISQTKHCSICLDTLEEVNEYQQKCGHKICLKCAYDIYDLPSKSKPFVCPTCTQIDIKSQ